MHLGALLAVLPLAAATVSFNGNVPTTLARGSSTTVKWTTDKNPVKILLVSDNYALIDVVCNVWITNDVSKACTSDKGEVTWTPNNDVPIGRYSLEARDADGQTASSNFISIVAQGQGPTTSSTSSQQPSTSATTGTSSGTSTTTSGSSTGSQTSPTGSTDGDPSDGNSNGLSTGAKVGAGVGAAIGGVGVLGLLGFLFFRMGKKAAAKKNNQKDDGSGGEEGDVAAGAAGAKTAAAAADDDNDKETGPAEMAAPDVIHEAPDYKQRLESPGGNAFFSELDATGGSFVLPSSRPSTAAGAAGAVSSPTDAGRPETPQITVTAPEGESTDAAAVSPLMEPATTAAGSESNTTAAGAPTEPATVEENTTTAESSGTATEAQADATTSGIDAPEKPTAVGVTEPTPTKTEATK